MEDVDIKIQEQDVFEFRYKNNNKVGIDLYHCFDGILVAKGGSDGEIYLEDTFWSSDSRRFTPEQAFAQGELIYICNLDEMTDIKKYEKCYYDDDSIITLSIHKGYRPRYLIKKGTQRSQSKMTQAILQRIEEEHITIRMAEHSLKMLNEKLKKVQDGDVSVYL